MTDSERIAGLEKQIIELRRAVEFIQTQQPIPRVWIEAPAPSHPSKFRTIDDLVVIPDNPRTTS